MKLICSCGYNIDSFEEGINDSLYAECEKCKKYSYNIYQVPIEEDDN